MTIGHVTEVTMTDVTTGHVTDVTDVTAIRTSGRVSHPAVAAGESVRRWSGWGTAALPARKRRPAAKPETGLKAAAGGKQKTRTEEGAGAEDQLACTTHARTRAHTLAPRISLHLHMISVRPVFCMFVCVCL